MHVRFSTSYRMPVIDDHEGQTVAELGQILIHADTGKVEGFFVDMKTGFSRDMHFLHVMDILRWGTAVSISSTDVLSHPDDLIRLQPLLNDPRTFLGQRILTESGSVVGRCKDVQFSTDTWMVEWIFPKKFWKWGVALPVTEVIEVTDRAIIVKDAVEPAEAVTAEEPASVIENITELAETGLQNPTTFKKDSL